MESGHDTGGAAWESYVLPGEMRMSGFDNLEYSQMTGEFLWLSIQGRCRTNGKAGSRHRMGYWQVKVGGKNYLAHRLAWFFVYGEWPKEEIDHINGVKDDNRIDNLRDVSRTGNMQNIRTAQSNNKSGFLGVAQKDGSGRWQARITHNRHCHYIGSFDTAVDAHAAYVTRKRKLHAMCTI